MDSSSSIYCSVVDFLTAEVEVVEVVAAEVALGRPAPGRGRWGSDARLGTVDWEGGRRGGGRESIDPREGG